MGVGTTPRNGLTKNDPATVAPQIVSASAEEIPQAQTDLLRGLGTDAAQPATALLKSWAMLMAAAPSIASGTTATLAGIGTAAARLPTTSIRRAPYFMDIKKA
ncbi:hypothetical protein [Pandoraea cepalis]|uniref:hypothetical protein n=1 Tax=Pandoraea cepalis TaxID=2508294 RepID=UPI00263BBA91|nr:hypothetical protein [Pandoraea cepalis]